MSAKVTPELITQTLQLQGVATEPKRAQAHAALTATVLDAAAPAFARLAFEQEPAGYLLELERGAR